MKKTGEFLRKYIIFAVLLCLIFAANAQTESPAKLTPFTGMDYVRVTLRDDFIQSSKHTFKVSIRGIKDNDTLWEGYVNLNEVDPDNKRVRIFKIDNLKPKLWTPSDPHLYELSLKQFDKGTLVDSISERLGFRFFQSKDGNLFLNGKRIFLRGFAVNPPNRGIPSDVERSRKFAEEYVSFMKSLNVNIIRIPDDETWYDVCDELGMMVFGGNYAGSAAKGAKVEHFEQVGDETDGGFPSDYDRGVAWYKYQKLGTIAHHPSLMIYAMTNETPFAGKRAVEWEKFLTYSHEKLREWDETRAYIANAGYGYGKAGDICDLHRYWGWYYASPFTYLHTRDNQKIIPFTKKQQPITFTETIGNYTGPDGRYNLTPAHKNPGSQLNWTGHERQDLQAKLASDHQIFTIKNAVEIFRRLRSINHELSGIFPFTVLFYNWDKIKEFQDMDPKPAAQQIKLSFQPILLSWECWTTQLYSGATIRPIAHIVNDQNNGDDLKQVSLVYHLVDKVGRKLVGDTLQIDNILYYESVKKELDLKIPTDLSTGDYLLEGTIYSDGKEVSKNNHRLFIADRFYTKSGQNLGKGVLLYDPSGNTAKAFEELGITFRSLRDFNKLGKQEALVLGENSADKVLKASSAKIKRFVEEGGRVLSLRQDSLHLPYLNSILERPYKCAVPDIDDPAYPSPVRPSHNGYYVNAERIDHPTTRDIHRKNFHVWSDYTNWNEEKAGFPAIYPVTDGFMPVDKEALESVAILCNYGAGLEGTVLAEQFIGNGSVLLGGFDLVRRAGLDPVADRLLLNLITYTSSDEGHELHPLISNTILWGDYETEKGILTGVNSGFIINASPRIPEGTKNQITLTEKGDQFAPGVRVAFATKPGLQYVANGRRPFGPYYLRGFGAMPEILDKESTEGTGYFWCRVLPGVNLSVSKVWNPSNRPLVIHKQVNDAIVKLEIPPNSTRELTCAVSSQSLKVSFRGDRRLVVLETAFIHDEK
ncbi:glycoside hydrolase family 2 TIM barrel-domain containing protein [Sphingobacterium hotanense]|uniref:glycoside hydrolase family 2 TIM barrel-domain containing protein n=1 Tax=Sphingobacterium hotanense TaxID=649196 RepID=UPI0021A64045|nr:glycoside hydrolase family 2 TIM barrel-domain containing protein [Sphingobacterium hotanense]MCT1524895.1 hypothetical protein [Sphingobacterium hotanense]